MCATSRIESSSDTLRAGVGGEYRIQFGGFTYPYYLASGRPADLLPRLFELPDVDRYVLVCDSAAAALFADELQAAIAARAPCHVLSFAAVEKNKNLATLQGLSEAVIAHGVTRSSCIVALGGGIAGNVAGMLAAMLFRGIRLVHMPTTLMAMLDSVLSLKQAANSTRGKNLIGLFHAPEMVLTTLRFLDTVGREVIVAGLCELVKNLLAITPEHIASVAPRLNERGEYADADLKEFIRLSIEAKMRVMADDPFEKGRAVVLEYGHTIGHAIELASEGGVTHGIAIGLGMLCAARISRSLGHLAAPAVETHQMLLEKVGALTALPAALQAAEILSVMRFDNKRGYRTPRRGHVELVLLRGLGAPLAADGRPLVAVPEGVVVAALGEMAG